MMRRGGTGWINNWKDAVMSHTTKKKKNRIEKSTNYKYSWFEGRIKFSNEEARGVSGTFHVTWMQGKPITIAKSSLRYTTEPLSISLFSFDLIQSLTSHPKIYTWRNCNRTASWFNGINSYHTKQMVSYVGIQCTFETTTIMMRENIKGLTLLSLKPKLFFMAWMEPER